MGQLCSYLIKRKCVLTIFFLSHMEKVRQQWQVASIENDESKKRFLFFHSNGVQSAEQVFAPFGLNYSDCLQTELYIIIYPRG